MSSCAGYTDGSVTPSGGVLWTWDDDLGRWVSPSLGSPQIYTGDIAVSSGAYTELPNETDYGRMFIQNYYAYTVNDGYIPQVKLVSRLSNTGAGTTYMSAELYDQDDGSAVGCGTQNSLGQLSTEISHTPTFCGSNYEIAEYADFTALAAASELHATLRIIAYVSAGTGGVIAPVVRFRWTSTSIPPLI